MTVADLLYASRGHHSHYRRAVAAKADAAVIDQHVAAAFDTREQAHALDPAHVHPAWQADPAPHETLMAFYRQRLGRAS